MNQYERSKHSPDFKLMCRVAEILEMPVSWFYTEDEDAARVQEVFFKLNPHDRKILLEQAERQAANLAQDTTSSTINQTPVTSA